MAEPDVAGTRWVRLDVGYFAHPKVLEAGRDGRDLHLASICYSGGFLTDGYIASSAIPRLLAEAGVRRSAVDRAVGAGLWLPNGAGFAVHDYTAMQDSRADVERERARWRDAQRRRRGTDGRFESDDGHA